VSIKKSQIPVPFFTHDATGYSLIDAHNQTSDDSIYQKYRYILFNINISYR